MAASSIGMITINISFLIYCLYFLPQLLHNQLKHKTADISMSTQALMVLANVLDLIYGFGYGLQWQYRAVTILTLACLIIQQWQIYRDSKKISYHFHLFIVVMILLGVIISTQNAFRLSESILENIGFISMICYSVYWLPQIIKNFQSKSAEGFSLWFILLNLTALVCDEISALTLGWPLPSIISPILIILFLCVLIGQYIYYQRVRMIIDSSSN
ncbi:PQ-loop repeat-containing protein [Fangia hongkongensis]|uniref:PQ-loop repeat-containing protein n=2 Tax=Fangia hongkongensis TaxID=270495 RepID=UPI000370582E|nr:PQ-loop repeat-containing protein [Fangia hongkongensis]